MRGRTGLHATSIRMNSCSQQFEKNLNRVRRTRIQVGMVHFRCLEDTSYHHLQSLTRRDHSHHPGRKWPRQQCSWWYPTHSAAQKPVWLTLQQLSLAALAESGKAAHPSSK